jgi:hypothetical protein
MGRAARVAVLGLCLAGPAQAQEAEEHNDDAAQIVIDTNLFCDTRRQVERFVVLFNDNRGNAEAAVAAVNAEQNVPDACVIATVAYQHQGDVASVRSNGASFRLARVLMLGIVTVRGLEAVRPLELFTLIPRDEESRTVGRR